MPEIRIVTDSGAHFSNPYFVSQNQITVIPNKIDIGGKIYREGIDINATDAMQLIARQSIAPTVTAPSVAEYVEMFTRVSHHCEAIVSIHTSREISLSWQNARAAAQQLSGHCEIAVVDSQSICAGQGMLVRVAVQACEQEGTVDDVVRKVRGAVERVYSMYYVENVDYLLQNKIMSASHTILGKLLGIKPFLTVEEGRLVAVEKVRTRTQAVERLCEFAVEFAEIEDAVILQHKTHTTDQARMLHDRLSQEFPDRAFPTTVYGTFLATLIGADATGIVILEEEMELEDDF
ncbi:MAG: DegV family protein [Aggregatilineales bacterium]